MLLQYKYEHMFFIMCSVARGLIRGFFEGWSAEMGQSEYEVYEGYFHLRGRIITTFRGFAVWHNLTVDF
jgi:hypothetical protein